MKSQNATDAARKAKQEAEALAKAKEEAAQKSKQESENGAKEGTQPKDTHESESKGPGETKVSDKEAPKIYKEAVTLYENGKYIEAKLKFEQVNRMSPGYEDTDSFLESLKKKLLGIGRKAPSKR